MANLLPKPNIKDFGSTCPSFSSCRNLSGLNSAGSSQKRSSRSIFLRGKMMSLNQPRREELFILDVGQKHRAFWNQVPIVDGILSGKMREYYKVMLRSLQHSIALRLTDRDRRGPP